MNKCVELETARREIALVHQLLSDFSQTGIVRREITIALAKINRIVDEEECRKRGDTVPTWRIKVKLANNVTVILGNVVANDNIGQLKRMIEVYTSVCFYISMYPLNCCLYVGCC